jgi:hypothetical protein
MVKRILRISLLLTTLVCAANGFLSKPQQSRIATTPAARSSSLSSTSEAAATMASEVKVGDKIPSVTLKEGLGDFQSRDVDIAELIAGKKVALFGVPGAFTPG